jgi:hypothetical protein
VESELGEVFSPMGRFASTSDTLFDDGDDELRLLPLEGDEDLVALGRASDHDEVRDASEIEFLDSDEVSGVHEVTPERADSDPIFGSELSDLDAAEPSSDIELDHDPLEEVLADLEAPRRRKGRRRERSLLDDDDPLADLVKVYEDRSEQPPRLPSKRAKSESEAATESWRDDSDVAEVTPRPKAPRRRRSRRTSKVRPRRETAEAPTRPRSRERPREETEAAPVPRRGKPRRRKTAMASSGTGHRTLKAPRPRSSRSGASQRTKSRWKRF